MIISKATLRTACRLLVLSLAALFAAGCQSARQACRVTSPPPPRIGSAPIAAYDEYALALNRQMGILRPDDIALVYLR